MWREFTLSSPEGRHTPAASLGTNLFYKPTMKTFLSTVTVAALLAVIGSAFTPVLAADAPKDQKAQCLACHGPSLEKFLEKSVQYKTDGQVINPHRFVPHDSKKAEDFPDCLNCHKPHALPPPQGYHDTKVQVTLCYDCHHNYKFEACNQCHK